MNAVFEAAQYVDASDPTYTFITYKPGEARDMPVLKAGNYRGARRDRAARLPGGARQRRSALSSRAPAVSSWPIASSATPRPGRARDRQPRLGLALRPGARRHAERFRHAGREAVASGAARRSGRALHRARLVAEMAEQGNHAVGRLSADRASRGPTALKVDEANALLWRQNPRRLDIEAYRDSLLRAAGMLDERWAAFRGSGQRHVLSAHDLRTRQPRAPASAVAAVRFPGRRRRPLRTRRHDRRRCSRSS